MYKIIRLSVNLPRNALLTIYKSFIRPHLDYGDISYNKLNNEKFQNKTAKLQYRASLAISGAMQRTLKEKNYDELCLHSLTNSDGSVNLFSFIKWLTIVLYLFIFDFFSEKSYPVRSAASSKLRLISSIFLKNTFSPHYLNEWNNLKADIKNIKSLNIFKKLIISGKKKNPLFSVYDPLFVKLLMRLRLESSFLNEHKSQHGFQDTLNSLLTGGVKFEITEHFLLHCQLYSTHKSELFDKIVKVDHQFLILNAKFNCVVIRFTKK